MEVVQCQHAGVQCIRHMKQSPDPTCMHIMSSRPLGSTPAKVRKGSASAFPLALLAYRSSYALQLQPHNSQHPCYGAWLPAPLASVPGNGQAAGLRPKCLQCPASQLYCPCRPPACWLLQESVQARVMARHSLACPAYERHPCISQLCFTLLRHAYMTMSLFIL
jgi:hypothetical protein